MRANEGASAPNDLSLPIDDVLAPEDGAPVSELSPNSEGDGAGADDRLLRELVDLVEERLAALNDPTGRARRRFVALLQGAEKKNASKRLALRARKFAQQGGRCARCGQMFNRTRKLSARIEEGLPLVCVPCERADLISGNRT